MRGRLTKKETEYLMKINPDFIHNILQSSEKAKEVNKKWRDKNKELIKEWHQKYYKENKEACLTRAKRWAKNNRLRLKERRKAWEEKNKDKINEKRRQRYTANPEVREKSIKTSRIWRKAHPEKNRQYYLNRRAKLKSWKS